MAEDEANKPSGSRRPAKKKTTRAKKSPLSPAPAAVEQDTGNNPDPASVDHETGNKSGSATPVTRPAGSGGQAVVPWLALVLGVVAMGVGGYAWYQGAVDSKLNAGQQETRLNLIERRIDGALQAQTDLKTGIRSGVRELEDSLSQSDADTREQIQGMRNEMENQDGSLRQRIEREVGALSEQIAALRSQLDSNLDGWVVEEIEQLVLIAWQRLQFTGETELAKQALQLAEQRLKRLSGSGVNEVRRLLSSDIAALDSVPAMDVPDLLNELSALSAQVNTLPLAGDIVMDADIDSEAGREKEDEMQEGETQGIGTDGTEPGETGETATLDRYLKPVMDAGAALLASLGDLVQIEKNDNPIKPVISAQIREMTYTRIRLILESAQIALVRENPGLYRHRIHAASEWVLQNFNHDAAATRGWLERLGRVGESVRAADIPDISATLSAIRALGGSESAL